MQIDWGTRILRALHREGCSVPLSKTMKAYTRLYTDETGESHFADLAIDLTLSDYAPPAPPLELSSFTPATQIGFMSAPAGWSSSWHPSSGRNLFVVLSGEWEVTASDGESRRFPGGSVLLVEDTTGRGHSSRVIGEKDSLAIMVQLGDY
jgi:hypothetical protein